MQKIDLEQLNETLFDAVVHRRSVQEVVARAYGCIGLPIIAFDVSFQLLAYAFPRPFPYKYWEQIAAQGRLSADIIDEDGSLDYQEMMYSSGKSQVFDWGTSRDYPQVDGPIMQGDSLVGYVGIGIEDAGDVDALLAANDLLADALTIALRDSARGAAGEEAARRSAEDLLLLDRVSRDTAMQITAAYPPPYVFAVLASEDSRVSTLQYVRSTLCSGNNLALGTLSKNSDLYILFYQVGRESDLDSIRAQLREVAEKYGFRAGISDFFSDAAALTAHRMQAMLALNVGRELPGGREIRTFRECYGGVICRSAAESVGLPVCLLAEVEKLAAEDAAEGTEYLPTLRAYLEAFQDRAAAAEKLGMHKNTVLYRIHKLEELTGVDLSDPACADRMTLGLAFHDLLNVKGGGGA